MASGTGEPAAPPVLLVVGRIGKPVGIKGEVTVEVRTDAPDERFIPGAVLLTDPPERGPVTIAGAREHGRRLVLALQGVADRNAAEALRDTLLQIDASTLPPLQDPDTFHDIELMGLRAELMDGTVVGTVTEILHLPAGDVLDIEIAGTGHLVPFRREMVPTVDVAGGRVVLDLPPGLLEVNETVEETDGE